MSDSHPSVFTQPDGDADDVLGHRIAAAADAAPTESDDVEGHGQDFKAMDKAAGAADFRASFDEVVAHHDDDGDDVEGHIHTS